MGPNTCGGRARHPSLHFIMPSTPKVHIQFIQKNLTKMDVLLPVYSRCVLYIQYTHERERARRRARARSPELCKRMTAFTVYIHSALWPPGMTCCNGDPKVFCLCLGLVIILLFSLCDMDSISQFHPLYLSLCFTLKPPSTHHSAYTEQFPTVHQCLRVWC